MRRDLWSGGRRVAVGCAFGLIGLLAAGGQRPPAAPASRANRILAAARAALASPAAALSSLQLSGAFRLQPPGSQQQRQGTLELRFLLPGRYQRRTSWRLPFGTIQLIQTLNGNSFWIKHELPAGGPGFLLRRGGPGSAGSPKRRQQWRARMERHLRQEFEREQIELLALTPAGVTVRDTGIAQARNGTQADMLQFSSAGETLGTLFLDRKTHRPLMFSYQGIVPRAFFLRRHGHGPISGRSHRRAPMPPPHFQQPQPEPILVHFTDWKRIQGRWLPTRITKSAHGVTFAEFDLKRARLNDPKLNASAFLK